MLKQVLFSILLALMLSSCATATFSRYHGIGRVKKFDFYSAQLPDSFDGFRIAFASDFHYESRFNNKRLPALLKALQKTNADALFLGGDYCGRNGGDQTELFDEIAKFHPAYGVYGVMGNHENNANYQIVSEQMRRVGIRLLEHVTDTIRKGDEYILVSGVRNPFDLKKNGISPTLSLSDDDFVILLTHTPDYVEDVDVRNTDLALAGHTHGGQVSLFHRYTPARNYSKYGNRFLSGLKYSSKGTPIIITTGIGTSRRDIRLFTPSEVVLVVLHKK